MEKDTDKTPETLAEKSIQKPVPFPFAPKKRRRRARLFSGLILLIVVCIFAGIGGSYIYTKYGTGSVAKLTSNFDGNAAVSAEEEDIASVAAKVSPSVVSVLTKSTGNDGFFGAVQQEGAGTGIIISSNGYILTNKHVVSGTTTVKVVTADGTTYEDVKVVGSDPLNDVAFLKIDGVSDLKPAQLGSSTSVRIGQKVVAIGNALGQYQNTVTSGIISGTGRSVTASLDGTDSGDNEQLSDLIQTDAAINSGNSGGPLVNTSGQVIGINTAIASDAQSVGFVIPISSTKGVIKSVLETGKVDRAYIGIRYLSVTPAVAKSFKLDVKQGAYVYNEKNDAVIVGSPADKAGIKGKDVITKVGDVDVGSKGSVATLVGEYQPGDTIELTILRGSDIKTIKLTLASYKS